MKAYVYIILVDGVLRYVGKGTGDRIRHHLKLCRSIARRRAKGQKVVTTKFYNRLTKALNAGASIECEIVADRLTDQAAFELEIAMINGHGGLWNKAPGGQGFSSEQWRDKKFRKKMAQREQLKRTPEYRKRRSQINQELWDDPAMREKLVARIWNDERRAKLAKARAEKRAEIDARIAERKADVEKRRAEREANRPGYHANSGSFTSGKAKVIMLDAWRDPEKRKKRLALFASPEYRAKVSAGVRKSLLADPDMPKRRSLATKWKPKSAAAKEAISKKAKERWADPEFRAKMKRVARVIKIKTGS